MNLMVHASKSSTHALCFKSSILQCTLSYLHIYVFCHITNQCTYELFAAQASGTHELKANARVNTSKCNYHIVGALELTLPLYSARPN